MLDMIPREARRLGVDERRRLIGLLRAQVLAELGKAGGEPDACPRCGGTHLVRKGHDRDGSQRWACRSCGRTLSRKTMGLLGYSKPEEDVWASYVEHACAGGTPGECARACGVCPGTSRLVRTGPSEAVGRALAPPGRGRPSPARSTARAPASRRPAGGPGRRWCCPGSRGARLGAGAPMEDQSSLSSRCSKRYICRTSWARRPFFLATARTLPRRLASLLIPAILTSPPGRPAARP